MTDEIIKVPVPLNYCTWRSMSCMYRFNGGFGGKACGHPNQPECTSPPVLYIHQQDFPKYLAIKLTL